MGSCVRGHRVLSAEWRNAPDVPPADSEILSGGEWSGIWTKGSLKAQADGYKNKVMGTSYFLRYLEAACSLERTYLHLFC
ncbi:hypothetical protein Y1Q_0000019 [Alligator mississippiensis]|uniref:Uncharacterized protein n=1 Tax=Alligator mississippiensis TaxID=8496 RepID=A0A151NUC2_ALLMI|nr:hypothetical protein Y1Q_0000019 [Alligator mississippiensis]